MITLLIYMAIGIFFAGFLDEDEPGWRVIIVLLWPILVTTIMTILIVSAIYEFGRKLHDRNEDKK